jgi:FtsZ-interacting cell division protein ZipA
LLWLDRRRRRQAGGGELQVGAARDAEQAIPPAASVARTEAGLRTEPQLSDLRAASTQRPLPVIDWQALEREPEGDEPGLGLAVHGMRSTSGTTPEHEIDAGNPLPAPSAGEPGPIADLTPNVDEPRIDHWPPEAERRICSLRIVPAGVERLSGRVMRQALQGAGFLHGPLGIFHHVDEQGRALISAASLSRPGQLEPATMDFQRLKGLHLFSVLPGPLPDRELLQQLFSLSAELAERVGGLLQDDRGAVLDAARRQELLSQHSRPKSPDAFAVTQDAGSPPLAGMTGGDAHAMEPPAA